MNTISQHLVTLYTRTPLHVGCGTSVDVVDLPIMRERISGFPVIPGSSLKGVLRDEARRVFTNEQTVRSLFGEDQPPDKKKGIVAHSGCVHVMEVKILAFPVRSLAGCFAWLTCPALLSRFQRDTGATFAIPQPAKDQVIAGEELKLPDGNKVVLEEYALPADPTQNVDKVVSALKLLTNDPLWQEKIAKRLAILHDENFQHFVTSATEVVARIKIDPQTRTNAGLFNQENVPCETLFYTVLNVMPSRRKGDADSESMLAELLNNTKLLQVGGDETTGHGLCEVQSKKISKEVAQ